MHRILYIIVSLIALAFIVNTAGADEGKLLVPQGKVKLDKDPEDERIMLHGFHSKPSPRNLLGRDRENPWSLPKASSINANGVDTLYVLGMRFDFLYEDPDEDSTTGRGKFDYRDTIAFFNDYGHMIDPSPHDHAYFSTHMQALRNYYYFVSGGKLELVWEIWPPGDTDVYHLPNEMRYYGEPNPYIGLPNYMIDAFQAADTVYSGRGSAELISSGTTGITDIIGHYYGASGTHELVITGDQATRSTYLGNNYCDNGSGFPLGSNLTGDMLLGDLGVNVFDDFSIAVDGGALQPINSLTALSSVDDLLMAINDIDGTQAELDNGEIRITRTFYGDGSLYYIQFSEAKRNLNVNAVPDPAFDNNIQGVLFGVADGVQLAIDNGQAHTFVCTDNFYPRYRNEARPGVELDIIVNESTGLVSRVEGMGDPDSTQVIILAFEGLSGGTATIESDGNRIGFASFDSYFLFHAGSDRQNDIFPDAYPPGGDTPFDLFTGYIFLIDTALYLDKTASDSVAVIDALIMPEQASQDNRAVALNSVMAHEFGHQLGLIDLYRTDNFFTRMGDFALMDNNGHGTGVDFGAEVGRAFGTIPVYPMAWSRAYLGYEEPVVYREGTDIELIAGEMQKEGVKLAKIPISEYEYFLIENRQIEIDGQQTFLWADKETSVILGPSDFNKDLSGEYDYLLPGSGMLIWKVDERVAWMDYNNNGRNNYVDNQLQINPDQPFVKLMEADGLVHFGGEYFSGYGRSEDMYRAGNNTSLTPQTNPPAIAYGGANTHYYITDISESDTVMTFDLEYEFYSTGFPQRAGTPIYGLAPIAADINADDMPEIIAASGRNLIAVTENGLDYTPDGEVVYDTSDVLREHGDQPFYPVPLFARTQAPITAGPVVGDFGTESDSQYIAVGAGTRLYVFKAEDADMNGRADLLFDSLFAGGDILWMSFGDELTLAVWRPVEQEYLLRRVDMSGNITTISPGIAEDGLYGICRIGNDYAVIAGDTASTKFYYIRGNTIQISMDLDDYYFYGPVAGDLDRDSMPEVVVATADGWVKTISVDTSALTATQQYDTINDSIFVNPVISDIDQDGFPDIILGGKNKILALNYNLLNVLNFPITIDQAYPNGIVVSSPVVGDINNDGVKDVIAMTSTGTCYAFSGQYDINYELNYGFPVSAGGLGIGPAVLYKKGNGGGLGFLGADGWFYSFDVGYDSTLLDWPMGGGGPSGLYTLPSGRISTNPSFAENLPEDQFFCYPNPTYDGQTTVRYVLGKDADVELRIYDMSGQEVHALDIQGVQGTGEEQVNLSFLPSGVYRCIIKADFIGGGEESSFTDVAIVK